MVAQREFQLLLTTTVSVKANLNICQPVISFIIITLPSGRGLVIPIFFRGFFWWSLAPDLRFSLGQTNTRRVFRYTGKGFYLE